MIEVTEHKIIKLTTTPEILRELASKLQEKYTMRKIGDSTFCSLLSIKGNLQIELHCDPDMSK